MRDIRGRTLAGAVVAAMAVGASAGAYVAAADPEVSSGGGSGLVAAPSAVPAALARGYAVFRRDVRARDSLRGYLSPTGDFVTKLGVNPDLARRIPTAEGVTTKVWVVPSADGACLLVMETRAIGPGGGCGPEMVGDPYGSADSSANLDGTIDVIGMVRDGVERVTLVTRDGAEREVPVADNVYVAEGTLAPREIRLIDPRQGHVTVPIAGY